MRSAARSRARAHRKAIWIMAASVAVVMAVLGGVFALKRPTSLLSQAFTPSRSYFVSPNGDDAALGTQQAPWRTLAAAVSRLQPGDELVVGDGVYKETIALKASGATGQPIMLRAQNRGAATIDGSNLDKVTLDIFGSNIIIDGLEVRNSKSICVKVSGADVTVSNSTIHDCSDHALYTEAARTVFSGNTVYRGALVNSNRNMPSGFPSGIKARVGAEDIIIAGNKTYNNYGEGIAVTRGKRGVVRDNISFDNYSVNIYIDNSYDILVEKNMAYCQPNSGFESKGGSPASAYSIGEEKYDGWGAQLARVTFQNNIGAFCERGLSYWGADVPNGGLKDIKIVHNTFYGDRGTILSLSKEPYKADGTVIAYNIFHHPGGKLAWIEDPKGITFHHNLWSGSNPPSNVQGSGDVKGQVQFAVAPNYEPSSFRLAAGSPGVNIGGTAGVSSDFVGAARDSQPDAGAFEQGEVAPVPASPSPSPVAVPSPTPVVASPTPSPSLVASIAPKASPSPTPVVSSKPSASNARPSFVGIYNRWVEVGKFRAITVSGKDKNSSDDLVMGATNLPDGFTLTDCKTTRGSQVQVDCTFQGVSTKKGNYKVGLILSDGRGGTREKTFKLIVY